MPISLVMALKMPLVLFQSKAMEPVEKCLSTFLTPRPGGPTSGGGGPAVSSLEKGKDGKHATTVLYRDVRCSLCTKQYVCEVACG